MRASATCAAHLAVALVSGGKYSFRRRICTSESGKYGPGLYLEAARAKCGIYLLVLTKEGAPAREQGACGKDPER